MTNLGLLQHFPSSPVPAQGRVLPSPSPAPPRAVPSSAGLEGTSPLHECHLVGPPGPTPALTPPGHGGLCSASPRCNPHRPAFLTAQNAPRNATETITSAQKGQADSLLFPSPHPVLVGGMDLGSPAPTLVISSEAFSKSCTVLQ